MKSVQALSKRPTDSDGGSVQGATGESKGEKDATATSFGAAMFGAVYNVTVA